MPLANPNAEMHTWFIATIALVAPLIPVEIEVLAYRAYEWNNECTND